MSNKLINVSFEDATNYVSYSNSDVVGLVLDHCWGPSDSLYTLSREQFDELYPESLPVFGAAQDANLKDAIYSYACAKRAFEMGASTLELIRPSGNYKHFAFNFTLSSVDKRIILVPVVGGFTKVPETSESQVVIYSRYKGQIPFSKAPYQKLKISVEQAVNDSHLVYKLIGQGDTSGSTTEVVLEELTFGLDKDEVLDGVPYFIENVFQKSEFFRVKCYTETKGALTEIKGSSVELKFEAFHYNGFPAANSGEDSVLVDYYNQYFKNKETSSATVLVSSKSDFKVYQKISKMSKERMDCVSIVGYPISDAKYQWLTPLEAVKNNSLYMTYMKDIGQDKFSYFLLGKEIVKCMGSWVTLDCTAGYAGRLCAIAEEVKVNQLPSAAQYGYYSASLVDSYSFDVVAKMHELGINSVYSAVQGPTIFGIRSMHPRQTSYFGKFNVSRVLTKLLAPIFVECYAVMHTAASADPTERVSFETRLNRILQEFIPDALKADSYISCSAEVNADSKTNGGEILNILVVLHFIKLVEKINIRIVATDSSVTAEIV